jgi:hypothetical protein
LKSFWMRKAVVPLVIACAGLQMAPGPALLTSALILWHTTDHAHAVSLVAEEGHVDLVLSHEGRGDRDRAPAEHHGERAASTSGSDHVFHLRVDATRTAPRPAGVALAPALATAVAILPASAPQWIPIPSLDPRSRSSDSLRTVVLRL